MSSPVPIPVACSQCEMQWTAELAESLNPERSPELRGRLRDRTLRRVTCPACGDTQTIDAPLLYADLPLRLWVHGLPEAERRRVRAHEAGARRLFAETFAPGRAPPAMVALAARIRLRVAFGLEELREKMVIAEAGLDDRVVEVLKLEVLAAHPDLCAADVRRLVVDRIDDQTLHLALFAGEDVAFLGDLDVQRALYDRLCARRETLEAHYPGLHDAVYVNGLRYRALDEAS